MYHQYLLNILLFYYFLLLLILYNLLNQLDKNYFVLFSHLLKEKMMLMFVLYLVMVNVLLKIMGSYFEDMMILVYLRDHQINKIKNLKDCLSNNQYILLCLPCNLENENLVLLCMRILILIFLLRNILGNLYHFVFLGLIEMRIVDILDLLIVGFLVLGFLYFGLLN